MASPHRQPALTRSSYGDQGYTPPQGFSSSQFSPYKQQQQQQQQQQQNGYNPSIRQSQDPPLRSSFDGHTQRMFQAPIQTPPRASKAVDGDTSRVLAELERVNDTHERHTRTTHTRTTHTRTTHTCTHAHMQREREREREREKPANKICDIVSCDLRAAPQLIDAHHEQLRMQARGKTQRQRQFSLLTQLMHITSSFACRPDTCPSAPRYGQGFKRHWQLLRLRAKCPERRHGLQTRTRRLQQSSAARLRRRRIQAQLETLWMWKAPCRGRCDIDDTPHETLSLLIHASIHTPSLITHAHHLSFCLSFFLSIFIFHDFLHHPARLFLPFLTFPFHSSLPPHSFPAASSLPLSHTFSTPHRISLRMLCPLTHMESDTSLHFRSHPRAGQEGQPMTGRSITLQNFESRQ
jgi:hypothetical protein